MNTQANKPKHLQIVAAGIAAILVSGIAVASIAMSSLGVDRVQAFAGPSEVAAAAAAAAPRARAYRCAECGVIESMRKIEAPGGNTGSNASGRVAGGKRGEIGAQAARSHEITIRLKDGSMRVITDANPASWRSGERVTIIAGVS